MVDIRLQCIIISALLIICCSAAPQMQENTALTVETSEIHVKTMSSESSCNCVPYYQCRKVISYYNDLLNPRWWDPSFDKDLCPNLLLRCCKKVDQIPTVEVTRPPPKPIAEQKKCGKRNDKGIGPLIFDTLTNFKVFGEFPWTVAVFEKLEKNNKTPVSILCGGSLIHPQIVLTAASCINKYEKNSSLLKIRAGEWDIRGTHEILPHQEREVKNAITHSEFNQGSINNDFGLLILNEPVDLSAENVGIACLPESSDNFDESRCFASGWGKIDLDTKPSEILKSVELPILPHKQCESALKTRLGDRFELHNSSICAGGEIGKDTCTGDGGSPLVCPMKDNPNKYVQAGIVSWGIGCGGNIPSVYASVAAGRNWINEQTTKAGFNINEYQNI